MILIAEIWLTVVAWKKGWGPMALIPIAVCVAVGWMVAASLGHPIEIFGPEYFSIVIIDFVGIGVLIAMIANAKQHAGAKPSTEVPDTASHPEESGIGSPATVQLSHGDPGEDRVVQGEVLAGSQPVSQITLIPGVRHQDEELLDTPLVGHG